MSAGRETSESIPWTRHTDTGPHTSRGSRLLSPTRAALCVFTRCRFLCGEILSRRRRPAAPQARPDLGLCPLCLEPAAYPGPSGSCRTENRSSSFPSAIFPTRDSRRLGSRELRGIFKILGTFPRCLLKNRRRRQPLTVFLLQIRIHRFLGQQIERNRSAN